jgi:hypothetical protein
MHIRINKRRVAVDPVCTEQDIYSFVVKRLAWPKKRLFLDFSDDRSVEILNLEELKLACRLVSEYLYNETKDWVRSFEDVKVYLEMEREKQPDDITSSELDSDDDLTMDDYYAMGFRHELVN